METNNKEQSEVKDILNQQRQLKLAREKVSGFHNKHVYIISGDFSNRGVIQGHFKTLGFPSEKVKATNTPAELLSRLQESSANVDLIICHQHIIDSRYSNQTGSQLIKIVQDVLHNLGSVKEIPVIFMEKNFEKKDIISSIQAGVSQFLVLPSDPVALANKLADVFEQPKDSPISQEVSKLILEGNKLQEQGLFEKAIACYNRALEIGGENVEVLTEKGNTLLKIGDVDQAIKLYKRATEIESNFPRAYQGLGMAYEQLGDFNEAKKNYKKVLELEPQNVQIHYNLGMLHQDEGDCENAESCFKQGLKLNPSFVKNYLGLAKNYEAMDNHRKALKVYRKAIDHNPNQTFLYVTAGDFCLKHSMNAEAEEIFSKAISANEKHIHLYNRMGIALRKQKKYNEAITNFAKAIKISPQDPALRYNLAKAYYIKGDEITAMNKLQKAFEMEPELKSKFEQDRSFAKLMAKYPDRFE